MRETFETPEYLFDRNIMGVQYSNVTGQWNVKGKNADRGNALANMTYGTGKANAYRILEDSLNLRDTRIFDVVTEDGKEKRVLNKKETMLASQKQEAIREGIRAESAGKTGDFKGKRKRRKPIKKQIKISKAGTDREAYLSSAFMEEKEK